MEKRWFKKRKAELLDVDEVFFDSFKLKAKDFRWEHRLEAAVSLRPMRLFWFGALALLVFFASRSFYLEIVRGGSFQTLAQQNYVREVWQRSPRGIIYASDLTPLVSNISTFNLVAIPAEIPRKREAQERIIEFLQGVFKKDREAIQEIFEDINRFSFRPVPILTDLAREEVLTFQSSVESLPGLRLEENFKRNYQNQYFSHVLGYTGLVSPEDLEAHPDYLLTDLIGKDGLETNYEDVLRGQYGKTEIEIGPLGDETRTLSTSSPEPGKNLVLFLDKDLQNKLTDEMRTALRNSGFQKAAAVVLDPRSGGILALQSFPLYDNNVFSSRLSQEDFTRIFENPFQPLFNRAISGLYPPGSTIKPFIATAAVEENVIDENTTVYVTGSITVAGQEFRDWRPHGLVDLKKAIAISSNVFFYTVGGGYGDIRGLGPYLIKRYLSRFGFGSILGIDLPGERAGVAPDPEWKKETKGENWYIGDTYNTSIGQGDVLVSPLGMASAAAAIANGGTLLKPRVVRAVAGPNLEDIKLTKPEIIEKNIASQRSLNLVREGMRETILSGSAQSLNSLPVTVAGKTGTAQSGGEAKLPHAWFVGFAPYDNPQIAIAILIENGGGGASMSVPIARNVLDWYFTR